MTTWHYKVLRWAEGESWGGVRGDAGLDEMLARQGEDGWELVRVLAAGGDQTLFFKKHRPQDG